MGCKIAECSVILDKLKSLGGKVGKLDERKPVGVIKKGPVPVQAKRQPTTSHSALGSNAMAIEGQKDRLPALVPLKTKPVAFIMLSDQAAEERSKLAKIMGVVYPGHGEPSVEDMIGGLRVISASFGQYNWSFTDWGIVLSR